MSLLTPQMSAFAANNVYQIISNNDVAGAFHSSLLDSFDLSSHSRFEGTAGALIFKYRSGFGVIAKGKGQFQGDALLVIRGTKNLLKDGLFTDGNIGFGISPAGQMVHNGFNNTFGSFFGQHVRPFLSRHQITRVHCVGHSLGGALATLAADRIATDGLGKPILYTFGSPRVGSIAFAQKLTASLGPRRIFRVCHKTDIVSLVPLWPFTHVPRFYKECYIESPGVVPGLSYHYMEKYIDSVKDKTWRELRKFPPPQDFDAAVIAWLQSQHRFGMTVGNVLMFNHAIAYLLKKILYATGIVVQTGLSSGLTAFDALAQALAHGAAASKQIKDEVGGLLRQALAMLGKATTQVGEITASFIRSVLMALTRLVYRVANGALEAVHRY